MKMTKESQQAIKKDLQDNLPLVEKHYAYIKESGQFIVSPENRLLWDAYHGIVTKPTKELVRDEDLNDRHIEAGIRKALKQLKVI